MIIFMKGIYKRTNIFASQTTKLNCVNKNNVVMLQSPLAMSFIDVYVLVRYVVGKQ